MIYPELSATRPLCVPSVGHGVLTEAIEEPDDTDQERTMQSFHFGDSFYQADSEGFLLDPAQWDQKFAEGMAGQAGITEDLSSDHWRVIYFIRNRFFETGKCPMVHELCRSLSLRLADLKRLFPSGYLRGACKLAGLTYREEEVHSSWLPKAHAAVGTKPMTERIYRTDIRGFMIDPSEWDREYATWKSREMKMPGDLTPRHWDIIEFLRTCFEKYGKVPTVYETCEANAIDIDELEALFPDGYHLGAVKIAGLRVR